MGAETPAPSRCRRHEAPRTAAEANGGPGGARGGANVGGAARAAAPGPAARLGVQVASGANHREGCRGGGDAARARLGPAGPYYAVRGVGSATGPGRGAAPCGAGAALLRRHRPGPGRIPGIDSARPGRFTRPTAPAARTPAGPGRQAASRLGTAEGNSKTSGLFCCEVRVAALSELTAISVRR